MRRDGSQVSRALHALALAGALAAAFALAGCGRKGPLDPPPSAANITPANSSPSQPALGAEGEPDMPPAQKKRILLDPLLN